MADEALQGLIELSKHFGASVLRVQGAGGNCSVKSSGTDMYIKASGVALNQVSVGKGYVVVDWEAIRKKMPHELPMQNSAFEVEEQFNSIIDSITQKNLSGQKASIETAMHAICKSRFVAHTHPVAINILLCAKNGQQLAQEAFASMDYVWVPFAPPGIYLAHEVAKSCGQGRQPRVFLLANHGAMVQGDSAKEVIDLFTQLEEMAENYLVRRGLDRSRFAKILDQPLSEESPDIFPDTIVFRALYQGNLKNHLNTAIGDIFQTSDFICKSILSIGETISEIHSDSARYILGMSREKHRQSLALENSK